MILQNHSSKKNIILPVEIIIFNVTGLSVDIKISADVCKHSGQIRKAMYLLSSHET